MSYYYFKNGRIVEFDFELTEDYYNVGFNYDDISQGKYVKLSEDQIQFRNTYPNASVIEIWNMKIDSIQENENTISEIKLLKSKELLDYYHTNIEKFTLDNTEVWLDQQDRIKYMYIFNVEEASGRVVTNIKIQGIKYKMTTENARQLLYQVELYSIDCQNVLETKLQELESSNDLEFIKNYDITVGYPQKLQFTS